EGARVIRRLRGSSGCRSLRSRARRRTSRRACRRCSCGGHRACAARRARTLRTTGKPSERRILSWHPPLFFVYVVVLHSTTIPYLIGAQIFFRKRACPQAPVIGLRP